MAKAEELAATIAQNGPLAVRKIKEAVRRTSGRPYEEAFKIENEIAREVMKSEDAKEGPRRSWRRGSPITKVGREEKRRNLELREGVKDPHLILSYKKLRAGQGAHRGGIVARSGGRRPNRKHHRMRHACRPVAGTKSRPAFAFRRLRFCG